MILDTIFTPDKRTTTHGSGNDKIRRSLVKTISWRIIGTIDTIIISWFITGTLTLALSIGVVELVSKMTLYYLHERAWNKINWGK